MKFTIKKPVTDRQLSLMLEASGWKKIKEPKSVAAAVMVSLPFSLLLGAVTLYLIYLLEPGLYSFLWERDLNLDFNLDFNLTTLALLFFSIVAVLFVHEFLHAVFIPGFIKSDKTYLGFNGFTGFVYTTEKIKRGRFIVISVMPYILLSVALPCLLKLLGLLNGYAVLLCFANAVGSGVDVLNAVLLAWVPGGAMIINNGFDTFYM